MQKYVLIWIFAAAFSLVAGLTAMGAIAKNKAPNLAISLPLLNGFASESMASDWARSNVIQNQGQLPRTVDSVALNFAVKAFREEPITPESITIIALSKSDAVERKLMNKAFSLSRRQKLLTAWMIVDSGAREDIPALLYYYDTMLRTSSSATSTVLPIMAKALSNKDVVDAYADILSKNPPWAKRFWERVVSTPEAIENAAVLRTQLYKKDEKQGIYRDSDLIRALVRLRKYEVAGQLFDIFSKGSKDSLLVRNGSFASVPEYPPFDWQLFSTGTYGASIGGRSLNLSAIRQSGGMFARQLVKMPYSIMTLTVEFDQDVQATTELFLELSCAEDRVNPPNPIKILLNERTIVRKISNKEANCEYYWLSIYGKSLGERDGFDTSINSITLLPIRGQKTF